ncbi:MAG: DUF6427 family protein [Bacteroidota bacterium]
MIANFFNKSRPINFLVLFILSFIVYIAAAIYNFSGDVSVSFFIRSSIHYILYLLLIFLHNFITRKNSLTESNTYALLVLILLFAVFPTGITNQEILISNLFLFFSFRRIYSLRTSTEVVSKLFDAGFWVGVAFLFYSWSLTFLILIYFAILFFRKLQWNYFIIPIIGFITPVFLYFVYLFTIGDVYLFNNLWIFEFSFDFSNYNVLHLLFPLGVVLVYIIWTIYPTLNGLLNAKKEFKATFTLLLFHLFLAVVIIFISPIKDGSEFLFIFFPFSILITNYLQIVTDYWFKETILIILVLLSITVYFLP